jgi:hypothetical protein
MNIYKVPKKAWNKWTTVQQLTFNNVYAAAIDDQELFIHPKADPCRQEYWDTTAWNMAWIAACAVQEALEEMSK